MTRSFFEKLDEVRRLLSGGPNDAVLDRVSALLEDRDVYREFWHLLDSPGWLRPLRRVGYFAEVPEPKVDEPGHVTYAPWGASQYLSRMAEHEPALVAEVLSQVTTPNPHVLGDMVHAGVKMPVESAAVLASNIADALDRGVGLWVNHQEELVRLVQELAASQEAGDQAYELARAYLFPKRAPDSRAGRRDDHWFLRALESLSPVMVSLRPRDTLRDLGERLAEAICAKQESVKSDPLQDLSYIWRPAIEDHEQNRPHDLPGRLVTPLRNAAEQAVRDDLLPLTEVVALVGDSKYLVFRRLAVHLINVFADREPELARAKMMDEPLRDAYRFKHEYAMLIGARFGLLGAREREQFFGWVDRGPDMSDFDDWARSALGRDPMDEDRTNRVQHWQYERLWWVRKHLTAERKARFDELQAKYGEPDMADLNVLIGGSRGLESPIAAKDFEGLPFAEVLKKVCDWRPEERQRGHMLAEGLQDAYGSYVRQNAEALSDQAELLIDKPAMVVRPFIDAMERRVNEGKAIAYDAVFNLCRWVLDQPREKDTRPFETGEHDMVDRDWQWSRSGIAALVERACEKKIDFVFRERLWNIIGPLSHDPDQNYILDDDSEDIRTKDFSNHSINNPRGKALHAIFAYARWVANNVKEEKEGLDVVPRGFDSMREVKGLLEAGLKSGEHDTFAVRAAYGMHTGLLYWIDSAWLQQNTHRIFDLEHIEEDSRTAFGWAAWNAFLVYTRPHVEYFQLLRDQFKYAVKQYWDVSVEDTGFPTPAGHLGQHLIALYGRGQLDLDANDDMLRGFLTHCHQSVRSNAISFVGQSLRPDDESEQEKLPAEVVERFVRLWEWYWPEVGAKDEPPSRDLFGYWYLCDCFDRGWALRQLARYTEKVGLPEPDYELDEKLAADAELDPGMALSILATVIHADVEGWRIMSWEESIKKILAEALKADEATRTDARALIDRLGRRGFTGVGELLR